MLEGPFSSRAHHFGPKDVNPWEKRGERRVRFSKTVIDSEVSKTTNASLKKRDPLMQEIPLEQYIDGMNPNSKKNYLNLFEKAKRHRNAANVNNIINTTYQAEKVNKDFMIEKQILEEGNAKIKGWKLEFISRAKSFFKEYILYPLGNDYSKGITITADTKKEVDRKNKETFYWNQALGFFLETKLKDIDKRTTDNPKFKDLSNSFSEGYYKEDGEDVNKAVDVLKKLHPYLDDINITLAEKTQKVKDGWNAIGKAISKQISIANQRLTEIEAQHKAHTDLTKQLGDTYEEPALNDSKLAGSSELADWRAQLAEDQIEKTAVCLEEKVKGLAKLTAELSGQSSLAQQGNELATLAKSLTQRATGLIDQNIVHYTNSDVSDLAKEFTQQATELVKQAEKPSADSAEAYSQLAEGYQKLTDKLDQLTQKFVQAANVDAPQNHEDHRDVSNAENDQEHHKDDVESSEGNRKDHKHTKSDEIYTNQALEFAKQASAFKSQIEEFNKQATEFATKAEKPAISNAMGATESVRKVIDILEKIRVDSENIPEGENKDFWKNSSYSIEQSMRDLEEAKTKLEETLNAIKEKEDIKDNSYSGPTIKDVDSAIEAAKSGLKDLKRIRKEYQKMSRLYNIKGDTEMDDSEKHRVFSRYYITRAKETGNRSKVYKERLDLLKACGFNYPGQSAKCISLASQIAALEKKIANNYKDMSINQEKKDRYQKKLDKLSSIDEASKTEKNKQDIGDFDDIIKKADKAYEDAKDQKNENVAKIEGLYRQETIFRKDIKGTPTSPEPEMGLIDSAKKDRDNLDLLRKKFEDSISEGKLDDMQTNITDSITALENSLPYMLHKIEQNYTLANKKIKSTMNVTKETNIKEISGDTHLVFEPEHAGLFVASLGAENFLVMEVREIRRFKHDPETGQSIIDWRYDNPRIEVYNNTKDMNRRFTRRVLDYDVDTDNKRLTINIPGKIFNKSSKNDRGKIHITSNGKEETYDAMNVRGINIFKHEKHEGKFEISHTVERKTMPDQPIMHAEPLNKLMGWERLDTQKMFSMNAASGKWNLGSPELRVGTGVFDYTETLFDPNFGVVLVVEGRYTYVCPQILDKVINSIPELKVVIDDFTTKKNEFDKRCMEHLAHAMESRSRHTVQSALMDIDRWNREAITDTSALIYTLMRSRKSVIEDEVRGSLMGRLDDKMRLMPDDLLTRISGTHMVNTELLVKSFNKLKAGVNHSTKQAIESKNKTKQNDLRGKICSAFHYKNHDFQLLVNPNESKLIKCANPDTFMLIDEFDTYITKKIAQGLTAEEDEYLQDMQDYIRKTEDIYLINEMLVIEAEKHGNNLDQVFNLLRDVKSDTRSLNRSSDNGLDRLREDCEFDLANYFDKAIASLPNAGFDEIIHSYIAMAGQTRASRRKTLEDALEALNPYTPPADALKVINSNEPDKLPPSLEVVETKTTEDFDSHFDNTLKHLVNDVALAQKDPARFAEISTELSWTGAIHTVEKLLRTAYDCDIELYREIRANERTLLKDLADQYQKNINTILQLKVFDDQKKLMFKMMMHELLVVLATNGNVQLRQFQNRIGNLFQRLIADLFKILGISK
ncbi:MAG TPA: hypothetical protein VGL94_02245 [Ktedonobacteraceae bacterium]